MKRVQPNRLDPFHLPDHGLDLPDIHLHLLHVTIEPQNVEAELGNLNCKLLVEKRSGCFIPAPKAGVEKPKESAANTDKVTWRSFMLTMKTPLRLGISAGGSRSQKLH